MGRNRIYIRAEKFGLLALIPLYFIVVGLMIQPLSDIIPGLWRIIKEPDFLITDYFLVGGIGAAFINCGYSYPGCHRNHLFPGNGDGRPYDHIQLSDVRIFPVWKESYEYMGDLTGGVSVFQIP